MELGCRSSGRVVVFGSVCCLGRGGLQKKHEDWVLTDAASWCGGLVVGMVELVGCWASMCIGGWLGLGVVMDKSSVCSAKLGGESSLGSDV